MQSGHENLVVGMNTGGPEGEEQNRAVTLTKGSHFLCASTIRSALCITLHMTMMQHVLTSAEHVAMWQVFIHISAFWMDSILAQRISPPSSQTVSPICVLLKLEQRDD